MDSDNAYDVYDVMYKYPKQANYYVQQSRQILSFMLAWSL